MPHSIRPGDLLADRYRLDDLLSESGSGRFWRAHDRVLRRYVALHVLTTDDPRVLPLLDAARRSAAVVDPRVLRVLDAEKRDDICYVVNEWGYGTSLDIALANNGPLSPRRAAWLVSEVAESMVVAHEAGVAHGRLVPENVLVDEAGGIRIIGLCVDAAMHGLPEGGPGGDLADLGGLLHAALTGRWAGVSTSAVPAAPHGQGRVLRPRQVRAGVPRSLDDLVDSLVNPATTRAPAVADVAVLSAALVDFVGDPSGIPRALAAANPLRQQDLVVLSQVPDIGLRPDPPDTAAEPDAEPDLAVNAPADPVDAGPADAVPVDDRDGTAADTEDPIRARIRHFTSLYPGHDVHGDGRDTSDRLPVTRTESATGAPEAPSSCDDAGERPLFAPTPPGGTPDRTPRPVGDRPADGDDDYSGSDTDGTGSTRPVPREDPETGDAEARVPGRRSLRLAALVALVALLLLVVSVALNDTGSPQTVRVAADPEPATVGGVITGLSAEPFAPSGEQVTAAADAALAVDDDPATAWRTGLLSAQPGPTSDTSGAGLLLDLGSRQPVSRVDLQLIGEPTGLTVYVLAERPQSLAALRPVADVRAGARERLGLRPGTTGRYVLVWMTALPRVEGGFEGGIADVALRGS